LGNRIIVQAAEIDIITVGVRSGSIKRVNPAVAAKMVFGSTRVEGVGSERIFALEQLEPRGWYYNVNETFFLADRAITLDRCESFELDAIADGSTVTTACKCSEFWHNLLDWVNMVPKL
jgi:hypothetical protein